MSGKVVASVRHDLRDILAAKIKDCLEYQISGLIHTYITIYIYVCMYVCNVNVDVNFNVNVNVK